MKTKILDYIFGVFKKDPKEIESLNGLRAFAILLVLFFHLWENNTHEFLKLGLITEGALESILSMIHFMDLFFLLSGLLIYAGLFRVYEKYSTINIKEFYIKRILRIYPAYYTILIITFLFSLVIYSEMKAKPNPNEIETFVLNRAANAISNPWTDIFLVSNYNSDRMFEFGWSLSLEQHFYIVLPFLCLFVLFKLPFQRRMLVLLGIYILPLFFRFYHQFNGDGAGIYYATHTRFDALFLGIIVFEIFNRKYFAKWTGVHAFGAFLAAVVLFFSGVLLRRNPILETTISYNLYHLVFILLTISAMIPASLIYKFFALPFFRPISRLSYTIYLWHGILAIRFVRKGMDNTSWSGFFSIYTIVCLKIFLSCWILYLIIERPFHNIKIKLDKEHPTPDKV
ncbi:acyltransferase [Leptospira gomenensis]|uniref:Acyltransferase n=1 Tax=Leptospira gomenensis TaxID=2484974 RepID=A0A5F1Y6U7_9LEPT|nr:acyltransferase [Leptospira gomenensis]TGK28187.1 acyltransferase [Leptospira gomenensis]TGK36959.1 acyltransferase [Leptospira gomenensis]TGK45596.1 acyltransferase [Leptospira gomenensis]TGK59535.1 acyltransferase [Leptospira gomenensis]